VLVNHWTEGNFQYRAAPPGLTARLCEGAEVLLQTDSLWLARITEAERSRVPRISVQEPYEEHFHAAHDDGWRELDYDDSTWAPAVIVAAPHSQLVKRGIPFLGGEIIPPTRVLASEQVEPCTVAWNLSLKPYFAPNDHSANFCFVRAYLLTWVYTEEAQQVALIRPHHHAAAFWLNGKSCRLSRCPPTSM